MAMGNPQKNGGKIMDHWVIFEQAMFDYGGYAIFLGYLISDIIISHDWMVLHFPNIVSHHNIRGTSGKKGDHWPSLVTASSCFALGAILLVTNGLYGNLQHQISTAFYRARIHTDNVNIDSP
jgi:hypothetical protein